MDGVCGIIYKVTNKVNGKIYIGQTIKSLNVRRNRHISDALLDKSNAYFHNAIRKYGKKNFKWEIITEYNSIKELNDAEIRIIQEHNSFENGYNLTCGGEGKLGCKYKHTEETKRKISESHLGKKRGKYGKRIGGVSEETRRKLREAQTGKTHTKETRKKLSELRIGSKNPNAKRYIITTPEGEKIFVHGIMNFCKNYKKEKLHYKLLIRVAKGEYKQYKGYRCRYYKTS